MFIRSFINDCLSSKLSENVYQVLYERIIIHMFMSECYILLSLLKLARDFFLTCSTNDNFLPLKQTGVLLLY